MTSFSKKVKKELSEINNLKNKTLDWFELLGYSLTNSSKEFTTESKYNINRYARILDNIGVDDYNISVSGKNFTIKTKKKLDEILKEKNPKEYNNIFNNEETEGKKQKENFELLNNNRDLNEKKNIERLNEIRDSNEKNKKENLESLNNNKNDERFQINEDEKKAIIRGAFLGSGTISEPRKAYHLEIYFKDEKSLSFCIKILTSYNVNVKSIRQNKNILYIEEGESISNFLAFVGAKKSVLEFEDTRVVKEIRNNVNRQLNLENANLNKTILSSVKQINYIKLIKKKNKFNELTEKEKKLAEIRLKNPDASLEELRKMLGENISKSGVSHRMKKIEELAKNLENEK